MRPLDVKDVLKLLNDKLHGQVDYSLFNEIFDAVSEIVPDGWVVVPEKNGQPKILNKRDFKKYILQGRLT